MSSSSPIQPLAARNATSASESSISPPEKPLSGDCCGSGCVRCVWDVYYEELEAYNNFLVQREKTSEKKDEIPADERLISDVGISEQKS